MQVGMIGLGRMGANLVRRLMRAGHSCVVYDVAKQAVQGLAKEGAEGPPRWTSSSTGSRRRASSGSCCRRRSSLPRSTSCYRGSPPRTWS
jgi:UDP-N-acetylmuramoylalanine-D-glutamate ligase